MVSEQQRLLIAWNVGGALVILIPLLVFWGSRIINKEDDNVCSWWKPWCSNGEQAQEEGTPWWCKYPPQLEW
jgi:hypothetical protein